MRRVMMLVLSALALPTAALASSISFNTGPTFDRDFSFTSQGGFEGEVKGPNYTITIFSPEVASNGLGFIGGTVTVTNTSTGATVFQNSLTTGSFGFTVDFITAIGSLEPNATIKDGDFSFLFGFAGGQMSIASVSATTVPEPSVLEGLLLGTGMLGLSEMTRRKLRLGT